MHPDSPEVKESIDEPLSGLLEELTVRPAVSKDYNFILASWAHSFRSSPWAGTISNHKYHAVMKDTIDRLFERGMVLLVACNKSDPDQLLGFVAFEKSKDNVYVVHYLFTKPDFREAGVARMLLDHIRLPERFIFTHCTFHSKFFSGGTLAPGIARRKNLEPVYI